MKQACPPAPVQPKIWSMTSAPLTSTGRSSFNGTVRYWNPLNAPAWGADLSHEEPGPLVAALLTFSLDASLEAYSQTGVNR